MCAVGKVRCHIAPSPGTFTANQDYVLLNVVPDSGGAVYAAVLDDNNDPAMVQVNSSSFEITELYAGTKVI